MSEARRERGRIAGTAELSRELGRSLLAVALALIAAPFRRLSPRASEHLISACALWALGCPLLLWISWSKTGFLLLLGSVAIAVAIIYLLIMLHPDDPF